MSQSNEAYDDNRLTITAILQYCVGPRNRAYVNSVLARDGFLLEFAPDCFKDDAVLVSSAVQRNGGALQFATPRLRDDTAIVLQAVKNDGFALEFASPRLKSNEKVVRAAIEGGDVAPLAFADPRLLAQPGLMLDAVGVDALALEHAPPELMGSRPFADEAIRRHPFSMHYFLKPPSQPPA